MDPLYSRVKSALERREPSIALNKDLTEDLARKNVRQVMRDNPQIFWYSYQLKRVGQLNP